MSYELDDIDDGEVDDDDDNDVVEPAVETKWARSVVKFRDDDDDGDGDDAVQAWAHKHESDEYK